MATSNYNIESLIYLLGKKRDSDIFISFLNSLNEPSSNEKNDEFEYLEFKIEGFEIYFENDMLKTVFLYSDLKYDDFSQYQNPLPKGISFDQTKEVIISKLGQPDFQGGGKKSQLGFGIIPYWIKYNTDNYTLHIEFDSITKSIALVTISTD